MDKSVILITGALTGIGRAAAVAFARKGAAVVVTGRRDEAGKALAPKARSDRSPIRPRRATPRRSTRTSSGSC
jgi:NAD(P)-dependent dehydrogenase (short-subunit alcohol dehydrogenase family)